MSALFRREALDGRRDAWLGRVQVTQPLPVRIFSLVSVCLVIGSVVFLALGTYTRRVQASGVLMPHAGLITVASPTGGLLRSTAVSEGARVERGQLLFEIDLDATSADGPTQARIVAELRQQRESLATERALKVTAAVTEKQALANQLQNLVQQHNELAAQIAMADESLPVLRARIEQLRSATRQGIALAQEFQNQTFIYLQTAAQAAQSHQAYLQAEGKIAEVQAAISQFDGKLAQTLNGIDREMLKLDQQVAETEARRGVRIVAPESGTLTAIRVHAGQTVAAGAPLVTVLQSGGTLEAHLYVDSSAIGFVRDGAPVLLRYAAFPFQRFGLYHGRVAEVTRAPVTVGGAGSELDQGIGGGPPGGGGASGGAGAARGGDGLLYRIVAVPEQPYVMVDGVPQRLEAGMRVEANIALDSRPLYRWLLDPVYRVRRALDVISTEGPSS